jgi:hypothetical protein
MAILQVRKLKLQVATCMRAGNGITGRPQVHDIPTKQILPLGPPVPQEVASLQSRQRRRKEQSIKKSELWYKLK